MKVSGPLTEDREKKDIEGEGRDLLLRSGGFGPKRAVRIGKTPS